MENKIKVLLGPSQMGEAAVEKLRAKGFEIVENPFKRKLTKDELTKLLVDIDGIIAGLEPLDRDVLETSTLKVISRCGSGINNVDLEAVKEFGMEFSYTPFGPTASVAELTLCNILSLLRNLPQVNTKMHNRVWEKNTGSLLMGKTIVIIGFGKIGQAVARLLEPFHVRLIAVDPYFKEKDFDLSVEVLSLEEALPKTDMLLLHSSSEDPILTEKEFEIIKDGAYILNASRGTLVDETALIHALEDQRISGAWFDVFKEEPYHGGLCDYDNVILTPHIASYTKEGRLKMENEAVDNLIQGFKNMERL